MNIFDDMMDATKGKGPRLNACVSCGRPRVVKPGDYCRRCAVLDNPHLTNGDYIVVEPFTLADTALRTKLDEDFLLAKYRNVHEMGCIYVVFCARGQWQDIVIDERFHVPTVMKSLFARLED